MFTIGANGKSVFQSKILMYLLFRYIAYGIQLINALVLLNFLGALNFGIYSFGLMLISYIQYLSLGIYISAATILAIKKSKPSICEKVWNTSFTLNLLLSLILIIGNFLILLINDEIAVKYQYSKYGFYIIAIGLLVNMNMLFTGLYRMEGKFKKINLNQLLAPLFTLLIILFLGKELSLEFLFLSIIIAHLFSFLLYFYKSPIRTRISVSLKISKIVIIRGLNLMVSNLSFQLITLSATTIVSIFFLTEQMGYFSLSITISKAVKMIVGSSMFVIYPKLLNKLAGNDNTKKKMILDKFHEIYVFSTDFITILIFSIIPIFDLYFTKYQPISNSLKVLIISQLVLNSSIGFSTLLIALKKERELTKIGFIAVISVLLIGFLIYFAGGSYSSMSFSVLIGMTIYSALILITGIKEIKEPVNYKNLIKYFSPFKLLFILIIIMSFIIQDNIYCILLAIILYIVLSKDKIILLFKVIPSLILNNNNIKF